MVRTIPISSIKKATSLGYKVFIIAPSYSMLDKYVDGTNVFMMPALIPGYRLVMLKRKHEKDGTWNHSVFDHEYVTAYVKELAGNPDAKKALNELYLRDKKGAKIALACYCEDPNTCHRSVILGLLQALGCKTTGDNYSPYWLLYKLAEKEIEKQKQ